MAIPPARSRMSRGPTCSPMLDFASPYARKLGLTLSHEDGRIVVTMPPGDGVAGRPGFLHGGAISGLLDYAAWVTVMDALEDGVRIKPVGITVDFMRGGQMEPAYAAAQIVRLGRRIANVVATAWQEDEAKPIASVRMTFLVERGLPPSPARGDRYILNN
jgi:uncharacterized protein (TIGR00369 family)